MPEQYGYTGTRIATDVKQSFGDEGNVQLTDDMLLRWVNDGQRQVAQDSDFSRSQGLGPLVSGLSVIDLSEVLAGQRLKQVEAVLVSGKRLELLPFAAFLDRVEKLGAKAGTPTLGMLRGSVLTLHPTPDATVANALLVYFTQWPADLPTLSSALTVPDRYYVALRDYVLAQAYQMNDDLEGSQIKLNQFVAGVQGQYEREHIAPTDIYPVVPADEEW